MSVQNEANPKVLAVDVGGTTVKVLATGQAEPRVIPSGKEMSAARMIEAVREATKDWEYDSVTVGYPGPVARGGPALEPKNLGPGWVGHDFAAGFGKPTKVINDAAMQALGSYDGGRMLFLGLGTGLGTALIVDRVLVPLELAHLPYKQDMSIEDFVGIRGLKRLGEDAWRAAVFDVVARLKAAMVADYVVLGGGNSKRLTELPPGCRLGDNRNAFTGGFRLWEGGFSEA
jgi:polyphosphate glucokinase